MIRPTAVRTVITADTIVLHIPDHVDVVGYRNFRTLSQCPRIGRIRRASDVQSLVGGAWRGPRARLLCAAWRNAGGAVIGRLTGKRFDDELGEHTGLGPRRSGRPRPPGRACRHREHRTGRDGKYHCDRPNICRRSAPVRPQYRRIGARVRGYRPLEHRALAESDAVRIPGGKYDRMSAVMPTPGSAALWRHCRADRRRPLDHSFRTSKPAPVVYNARRGARTAGLAR